MAYSALRVFLAKCYFTVTIALGYLAMKYKDVNIKQDLVFFCGSRYFFIVRTEMTNVNQTKSEGHT